MATRLEDFSIQIAGIMGSARPRVADLVIMICAGDHGIVAQGVSAFPQEATPQMVANILEGGAAISVLARHVGACVAVIDVGVAADLQPSPGLYIRKVAYGTADFSRRQAMTRDQAIQAVEVGILPVQQEATRGLDIVATGEMGIGNTTPSSAIIAAMTGRPVSHVTGRGTGINDDRLAHKVKIIKAALELPRPKSNDPLDVLHKVGGFEIGAIAGIVLGAAANRVPVIADGLISTAGALVAASLAPLSRHFMIAAHTSVEIGHRIALDHLRLVPCLDLDMRLGEGSGAALVLGLVTAACKILDEMATFEEAGVSGAE